MQWAMQWATTFRRRNGPYAVTLSEARTHLTRPTLRATNRCCGENENEKKSNSKVSLMSFCQLCNGYKCKQFNYYSVLMRKYTHFCMVAEQSFSILTVT